MSHMFDAMCSDGERIWCIDTNGILSEINRQTQIIKLVHWIDGIENNSRSKFEFMCYFDEKLIIAPNSGQSFWLYDLRENKSCRLTEKMDIPYVFFYELAESIIFVAKSGGQVAIYSKDEACISVKSIFRGGTICYEQGIRGGCKLANQENIIVHAPYGAKEVYEISISDLSVKKMDIESSDTMEPIVFAHRLDGETILVHLSGAISLLKAGHVCPVDMPEGFDTGIREGIYAPYHYWSRGEDGLLLMPCKIKMLIQYRFGKANNLYSIQDKFYRQGEEGCGIYPCCQTGKDSMIGFALPKPDETLHEFFIKERNISEFSLQYDMDDKSRRAYCYKKIKHDQILDEGDFGIGAEEFIKLISNYSVPMEGYFDGGSKSFQKIWNI